MKVAIIGAGLSGLACAHELKRNGIIPTIFEKKSYIGEVLDLPTIMLNVLNSPIKNPIKHLDKQYDIKVSTHYDLKEIIMFSPSKTYTVHGKLGGVFLRGREKNSLENQLEQAVQLPIMFNTTVNIDEIKKQYNHVVVAIGNIDMALQKNLAIAHFDAYVRIATVKGNFNLNSTTVWLNTKYAKHGYAYLIPSSTNDARLILIVDNIKPHEMDYYWNEFLLAEKITYSIHRIIDLSHTVGTVFPVHYENLYFTGMAGGFIDSLLGFGSLKSILSGTMAGRCIANGLDYNKEMQGVIQDVKDKYEFRKVYNTFDNKAIDLFVATENFPIIKQFLFNNPLVKATQGTFLARIYNSIKRK